MNFVFFENEIFKSSYGAPADPAAAPPMPAAQPMAAPAGGQADSKAGVSDKNVKDKIKTLYLATFGCLRHNKGLIRKRYLLYFIKNSKIPPFYIWNCLFRDSFWLY